MQNLALTVGPQYFAGEYRGDFKARKMLRACETIFFGHSNLDTPDFLAFRIESPRAYWKQVL
jgi:hypothetical protein